MQMLSSEKYVKLMLLLKRFLLTRAGTRIASLTMSHLPRSTEDIYHLQEPQTKPFISGFPFPQWLCTPHISLHSD